MTALERVAASLVALLALSAASCGSSTPDADEATEEPRVVAPIDHLPENAIGVVRADLAAARSSPYGETFTALIEQVARGIAAEESALANVPIASLLGETDVVHVALVPGATPDADPTVVGVAQGRWADGRIVGALTAIPQPADGDPIVRVKDIAGERVAVLEDEIEIAQVDGLGLGSSLGGMRTMLDRHRGRAGRSPLEADAMLGQLARDVELDSSMFAFALRVNDQIRAELADGADAAEVAVIRAIDAIGGHLSLTGPLDGLLLVRTTDATAAAQIVALVTQMKTEAQSQPMVAMLGLRPILDGVQARVDEQTARVEVHASEQDTRNLISRFSGFLEALLASAIGEIW